jgi:NAD(P)H-dependent flavin oxidoreductase YrpB (nitropropane dioxygenase family)
MSGLASLPAALRTPVCELFGVDLPIVQTGMGNVSDARLTAATAAAGGLGILSAALLSYDETARAIDEVRQRTARPFGVNLRGDQHDVARRIDLLVDAGVRVVSFAMAPSAALVQRSKEAGLVVVCSVGARRHAEKVAGLGVDAVIAQGGEGGGHTGGVPTSLLVPQVVDAVGIPVIAAGGFFDGRGLVAALAYGAAGIAMGTRFLLTQESPVHPDVKRLYLSKKVEDTILTRHVDGFPQRVLKTTSAQRLANGSGAGRLIRSLRSARALRAATGESWSQMLREGVAMRRAQGLTLGQTLMAANAPMLYRRALVDGDADTGLMATGQVVGLIDDLPTCRELLERIVAEAAHTLDRLGG